MHAHSYWRGKIACVLESVTTEGTLPETPSIHLLNTISLSDNSDNWILNREMSFYTYAIHIFIIFTCMPVTHTLYFHPWSFCLSPFFFFFLPPVFLLCRLPPSHSFFSLSSGLNHISTTMCVHVKHFCLLFNKKLSKSIFNFTACFVLFFVSFDSFVPPTFSVSFFSPLGDKEG